MSETHGRADQPSIITPMEGYTAWSVERSGSDKAGGGLVLLYKESLVAHQWCPQVSSDKEYVKNERQWLLLTNETGDRCAFLHCYVACQTNTSDGFIQWNEDLFHLLTMEAISLRRQGFMVIAMGDFNSRVGQIHGLEENHPDTNRNEPMFLGFVSEVNMFIMNTLPMAKGLFTRFMDGNVRPGSSSLLDYGLIDSDHVGNVTSFIIDEQARFDAGSDHALLECEIILSSTPHINWSLQNVMNYNYNNNSDFKEYRENLDNNLSSVSLSKFSDYSSSDMLSHLTNGYNVSAKKAFGLKIKKRKKGLSLPADIVNKIQAKNQLSRSLQAASSHLDPHDLQNLQHDLDAKKQEIRDCISNYRIKKRQSLRSKLLRADPSRKRFWRFLKSQIKGAGQISALYKVRSIFCHLTFDEFQARN